MSIILKAVAGVTVVATLAFLVAFFWFAFTAALRPGGPDPEGDAAGIALIGVFISAAITALVGAAIAYRGDVR